LILFAENRKPAAVLAATRALGNRGFDLNVRPRSPARAKQRTAATTELTLHIEILWVSRAKVKLFLLTRIRMSFKLKKQSCARDEKLLDQNRVLLLSPLAPAGLSAILFLPIEAHTLILRVQDARLRTHRRTLV
jgi:hypothetical protein